LQRTVSFGGVGSGAIVNEAAGEVSPPAFVAVTSSGPTGGVTDDVNVNVLLAPVPTCVKPATVGKPYVFTPDSPSVATALTVKLPLVLGR
jgi:hypothetical protein